MTDSTVAGTKVCVTCKVEKPKLAFSIRRGAPDQLNPQCRDCVSEGNKRRYRQHHQVGKRKEAHARFGHCPHGTE